MKAVTFGEIMMRLNPEGYLRFVQANSFEVSYAGGEANVAVSLANYGVDAAFVSKALRQPPFKPWRGKKTDVVDQAGKGHQRQRQPFDAEIRADPVRAEGFFTFHPRFFPFAA